MRTAVLFLIAAIAFAQPPDPAYPALARAYEALKTRDYDTAISSFLKGIEAAPGRASIRKDLAYTYLKVGENILARDQFRELFDRELIEREILVQGVDYPVAVGPYRSHPVFLVAVRVGISGQVKPSSRPALTIARRGQ